MTDMVTFDSLQISEDLLRAVKEMGFEQCTPIQGQAIPPLLAGRDIIGQAQTGTGKTAAFAIPMLEKIDYSVRTVQGLILCPTRELAIQVSEEIQKLLRFRPRLAVLPVYGGQPIDRQIRALRSGIHIVIGTPGRVMDHLDRKTLSFDSVKMIVLDEADEMLNMGFREDIETILDHIPAERQTVFFSATMPKPILALTKRYQRDPLQIVVAHKELTVSNIEQKYIELPERNKLEALSRIMDVENSQLSLVFCNTKRKVNDVVSELQARGYFADGLHGDLKQTERNAVLDKFKKGIVEVLVATDVAARGLDIEKVEAVFNYDVPLDEESYVHRIGRTGRAGKQGTSYTFVTGREIYQLRDIERYTKSKITRVGVPSLDEVEEKKMTGLLDQVKNEIVSGNLVKYVNMVEALLNQDFGAVDIAAAMMKLHFGGNNNVEIDLPPAPLFEDAEPGMARLFFGVGKRHRVEPKDFVGAIAKRVGIPGSAIGKIRIFDSHSFVDVPLADATRVVTVMQREQIKGNPSNVEIAKPKQR